MSIQQNHRKALTQKKKPRKIKQFKKQTENPVNKPQKSKFRMFKQKKKKQVAKEISNTPIKEKYKYNKKKP